MAQGQVPVGLAKRPVMWVQAFGVMGPKGLEGELRMRVLVGCACLRYYERSGEEKCAGS